MLDAPLVAQLRQHLEKIVHPIRLVASLDDSAKSRELRELLEEIGSLSPRIEVSFDGNERRRPSFSVTRPAQDVGVTFAGIPLGHEFTSLVLALLQVGGHPAKVPAEVLDQVRTLEGELHFETYFSLSCQICPDVVQALNLMAVVNPSVRHVAIDGGLFADEVREREVLAVPSVFLNGEPFEQGRISLEEIVARLDAGAAEREARKLQEKAPFDVLIVGGGPAGASAAIYAARKGIRTGIVAERFGGQVLDTLGIENLIAVLHTEGPALARVLEQNVRDHDVDVMNLQRATRLVPATQPGDLVRLELASGATLSARTVVLATGARWRRLGVPGEDEYINRGVAFCPHCDGPLFKGKRIAVIGGGNSGVEAAIDLAGIVEHVTLMEFDPQLRADQVLQDRLRSLRNTTVVTNAATSEVVGDGQRVTGLAYRDRASGDETRLELQGIFVQIGLQPNTEWLHGAVELSPRGEVVMDDRGRTSVAGVFAAGDCTTVPYKQIVIALGAGSTAVLSAFDYLIRTPLPDTHVAAA